LFFIVFSIVPMVDWAAHVGGTVVGIVIGVHCFGYDVIGKCSKSATVAVSFVLLSAILGYGFYYFYTEVNPCPGHKEGQAFTNYLPPNC
jgi:hypothetical protein